MVAQTNVTSSLANDRAQSAKHFQYTRERGPEQYQAKSITSTVRSRAPIDHNEHTGLQVVDPPKANSAFEHQKPAP